MAIYAQRSVTSNGAPASAPRDDEQIRLPTQMMKPPRAVAGRCGRWLADAALNAATLDDLRCERSAGSPILQRGNTPFCSSRTASCSALKQRLCGEKAANIAAVPFYRRPSRRSTVLARRRSTSFAQNHLPRRPLLKPFKPD
jgi:hypothetical protein